MGVPAFFRWLSRKYPTIVVNAVEQGTSIDGTKIPVDATQPNPNYQEFDNLYLDMNGIIHPCTHPEDRPAPKNEEEMFVLIFEYIDRLFAIVRPRKVLYMAIDGVAPRAKMNQQRSRRFRASKEAAEKEEEISNIRNKLKEEGIPLPPEKPKEEKFDSNCITPGTPFMARLAVALRYYVHLRVTNDPAWMNLKVILSDANVPGEGEHKIMDYIRRQRASPGHDSNTVHCLCGADADLIMLGLATHEVNFNILREEFVPNQPRPCELCHGYGHELKNCQGMLSLPNKDDEPVVKHTNFIFIRLPVLREYLARDLEIPGLPFEYDLERAIDDWVFMCFFVGNDFLPHLPSLEIREGAIDRLIRLYKDMVVQQKGWLTENGEVFTDRVEIMMKQLGKAEDDIFRNRQENELRFKANQKRRRLQEKSRQKPAFLPQSRSIIAPVAPTEKMEYVSGADAKAQMADQRRAAMKHEEAERGLAALLRPVKRKDDDPDLPEPPAKATAEDTVKDGEWREIKRKAQDSDDEQEPEDNIRLWEEGWKDRYYRQKFGVSETDVTFRRTVAWAYTEGLCWVLKYYYQGCASWNWYFPYHYAPFASDFDNISEFKPDFNKPTTPFNPLEQLMGVFPAASGAHIPECWRKLMTNKDSPIVDFYPRDFQIDLNGKKFAWQGVALLPFVDEKLLLETLKDFYHELSEEEKARNLRGADRLFIGARHQIYGFLKTIFEEGKEGVQEDKWVAIDNTLTEGMSGEVKYDPTAVAPGAVYETQFNCDDYVDIKVNNCLMVAYRDPQFPPGFIFPATRLAGAETPEATLKPGDWNPRRQGEYRPNTGFTRNRPQAQLGDAGHRMARNEMRDNRQNRPYQRQEDNYNKGPRHNNNNNRYDNRNPRQQYGQPPNAWAQGPPPPAPYHHRGPPPPQPLSFSQQAIYGAANYFPPAPQPPQFNQPQGYVASFNQPPPQRPHKRGGPPPGNPANIYGQSSHQPYGGYNGFFG
ncbi:unnamed protein product [Bursaphelenchus okinawaensis]|uniref:5'-3' exoribonuclease n=1 Tax=Bursaphelenchus okinawaensis TaxID=465554 RepID=A0A811JUV6_9BILA|nr:unnamed protein product [Bursaphelenchus okinawaensis]CAG9083622.1 unnamed protein product [Bursaphelenchus okinawaensis]